MKRQHQFDPWEHCPDCGAVLIQLPGHYYCSSCGFEDEIIEEGAPPAGRSLAGNQAAPRAHLLDQLAGSWPLAGSRAA